jgi:hypothetical protein
VAALGRGDEVWGEVRCRMVCSWGPFIGLGEGCQGGEGGVTVSDAVASMARGGHNGQGVKEERED